MERLALIGESQEAEGETQNKIIEIRDKAKDDH